MAIKTPDLQHVCALSPHDKFADTFIGVDRQTGTGYAIHRCKDQEGRECFILRSLPLDADVAAPAG